jgi:hypothetical protein
MKEAAIKVGASFQKASIKETVTIQVNGITL